ncbi:MAG TPA: hypothetical protein VFV22_03355 [Candidatus Paceibacterota bacterium]|nr:hypothetical protein [Candidatus Paceibacterota bacterium]
MLPDKKKHKHPHYFLSRLFIVVGIVLVWRGVWYVLDAVDAHFFGGYGGWTGLGGIIVGMLMLYVPDNDLKEIEKI